MLQLWLRGGQSFRIVNIALLLTMENGLCGEARIFLGTAALAPMRAVGAEKTVKGKPLNAATAEAAALAAVKGALPLAKNAYKIQITRTLVKRALLGEL